jgi:hypothetical protein
MSHRNSSRFARSTNSALLPYISELHFPGTPPRLTRRTVKIEARREIEVTEKTTGTTSGLFFSLAPNETTKKWSTGSVIEVEETYE